MSRFGLVSAGGIRTAFTALALFATAALSACSPTGGGGGLFGPQPGTGPAAVPQVTGEVIGSGQTRVALLLPLSGAGNAGTIATGLRNAADLALRDFPNAGVQILVKDDRGTPEGARAAATAAISEGAQLILGPLFAPAVKQAGSVARGSNVPVIAFSTDTTAAAAGIYLLSFLPQGDVERIVSFAASRGKRSMAALLPNNAYGTVVEAALQQAVAGSSGRLMAIERYDANAASMQQKANAVAALARAGTIDSIFMPEGGDAAPFLGQTLAAAGVRAPQVTLLGSGQWDDSRIRSEASLNSAWYTAPDSAGFAAFARRYQAAFGAAPPRTASLAYDATSLAAGLASRFGAEAFAAQTLTNPNGFIGADGAFRLFANGLNQRGLAVYEIRGGQAAAVSAAPKTFTRGTGM